MGLIALVPLFDLGVSRTFTRLGAAALGIALVVQSAFVWDYALQSNRVVPAFLRATPYIDRGDRVGTLLLDLRPEFRANPLRHAGTLLGVGTGGVVWSNYEAAHYYFPVQVRPGIAHPPVLAFEEISILDAPEAARERADAWAELLAEHQHSIDLLAVWGNDPRGLDPITARWFTTVAREGRLRILRRREPLRTGSTATPGDAIRIDDSPKRSNDGSSQLAGFRESVKRKAPSVSSNDVGRGPPG